MHPTTDLRRGAAAAIDAAVRRVLRSAAGYRILDAAIPAGALWDQGGCLIAADGIRRWLTLPDHALAAVVGGATVHHVVAVWRGNDIDVDGVRSRAETLRHWQGAGSQVWIPAVRQRLSVRGSSMDEVRALATGPGLDMVHTEAAATALAHLLAKRCGAPLCTHAVGCRRRVTAEARSDAGSLSERHCRDHDDMVSADPAYPADPRPSASDGAQSGPSVVYRLAARSGGRRGTSGAHPYLLTLAKEQRLSRRLLNLLVVNGAGLNLARTCEVSESEFMFWRGAGLRNWKELCSLRPLLEEAARADPRVAAQRPMRAHFVDGSTPRWIRGDSGRPGAPRRSVSGSMARVSTAPPELPTAVECLLEVPGVRPFLAAHAMTELRMLEASLGAGAHAARAADGPRTNGSVG